MSFSISRSEHNGIQLFNLHDSKQSVTISIVPETGAMLHAFELPTSNGRYNIIANYDSAAAIETTLNRSYKSSKLSPFPCRIENGQYTWGGQLFEFENRFPDGSAIHGLLFNKAFQVSAKIVNDLMASADFTYQYRKDDPGYPFDYTCTIRYTLLPDMTLQLQTILTNDGEATIPIADGWHPYFRLNAKVDDCLLQFPACQMVEFDEKLIPTGHYLPYNQFEEATRLNSTRLDNCFLINDNPIQPICTLSNPAENLSISFITDENYPYLQIYTPDDRQSIAIENLSGAPNCFNNKMGLLLLEPGTTKTMTLHYKVNNKK